MSAVPPPSISLWQAPIVPAAVAFTAGILLDRFVLIPLPTSLATAGAFSIAWFVAGRRGDARLAHIILWTILVALGASWHHWRVHHIAPDDVRLAVGPEGTMTRLRGGIDAAPTIVRGDADDPLRGWAPRDVTRVLVAATTIQLQGAWRDVSGVVQATIPEPRPDLRVGAEIELVGMLYLPSGPVNPGGFDAAAYYRDHGISALLAVPTSPGAVDVLRAGRPSIGGWLGHVRGWGLEVLDRYMPETQRGLAKALLLGDNAALTSDEWGPFERTGVVHALAISGQHLFILSQFLWLGVACTRLPRRASALAITLLLLSYALLTGARPPIMRAAWVSMAFTGAILFQRVVLPGHGLALAWFGVTIVSPAAIFETGCQLSFLAVALLCAGRFQISHLSYNLLPQPFPAALERVIDESRPYAEIVVRRWLRWLTVLYLESALVWAALTPLIAAHTHVVSPVAILIGPPVMLLTTLALLSGFLLLVVGGFVAPLGYVLGWVTSLALAGCNHLVVWGAGRAGSHFFVPDVSSEGVIGVYLALLGIVWLRGVLQHQRWVLLALPAWLGVVVALIFWPRRDAEFRCTFLAVGHGGCIVLETPRGRTIVYDAGAITGPEVTRRHIAPFLWSRGIRRIDELIISHGDLDHFNGVPALLERFPIACVTLTPSFAERATPGIGHTLRALERRGLNPRVVAAPERWESDGISFEALHPPPHGPLGSENARSLVLLVRYDELSILLTGDLEGPGLARLLALPPRTIDVLQAPHHGSRAANTAELAEWAQPRFVVSSQGTPRTLAKAGNPYDAVAARYLTTWPHGAVTIRRNGADFILTTHATSNRWTITR